MSNIREKVKRNLKKKQTYSMLQILLTILFVTCLLISNIAVIKTISLPFGIITTGAELVFPLTYILSDIFSEIYGYKWSRFTCYVGFLSNFLMTICLNLVAMAPYPDYFMYQDACETVFNNTPRIFVASSAAFIIGDFVNDKIFAKLKEKHKDDTKGFYFRALLSSLFGEITDSLIFIPIAFIGEMPLNDILNLIIFQVLVKVGYEVIFMPLTKICVNKICTYENE